MTSAAICLRILENVLLTINSLLLFALAFFLFGQARDIARKTRVFLGCWAASLLCCLAAPAVGTILMLATTIWYFRSTVGEFETMTVKQRIGVLFAYIASLTAFGSVGTFLVRDILHRQ